MSNQDKALELSDEQLGQVIGGHHQGYQYRSVHKASYSVVLEQHQSQTSKADKGIHLPPNVVFDGRLIPL